MFFPKPRKCTEGDYFAFSSEVKFYSSDAPSIRAMAATREFFPYFSFTPVEKSVDANLKLAVIPGISERAEYYSLDIKGGCVDIRAKDFRGLINALATMTQAIKNDNGSFWICDAEIEDYPDAKFRSFMADPHTGHISMSEMRATILSMAKAKMNKLHIHLVDGRGFSYISDVYPDLPRATAEIYTKDELREIVAYSDIFGIDVIPEIDIPGHSRATSAWNPRLKCRVKGENGEWRDDVSGWCLCLGNEECYTLYENLFKEIVEIFPYEYVHVGTDEIDMHDLLDHPHKPYSHSEECEVCNSRFNPMGLFGLRERFYWFVRRVYSIITSLGKKMMMWNDNIDISKTPDIPKDILVEFWRVASKNRGPREGCSMQAFLEEGFEVVNADFPNTYIEEYVEWDKLKAWDYRKAPADASAYPHRVLGGEMCAWGGTNIPCFSYMLYYAIPAFGARLWSADEPWREREARLGMTRVAFGPDVPCDFDFFEFTKGVPLGNAPFMDSIFEDGADLGKLEAFLRSLKYQSRDEEFMTQNLLKVLNK